MKVQKSDERMFELARKWQEGTITEEEKQEFNEWYHSQDDSLDSVSGESLEALKIRLYQNIIKKEDIPVYKANNSRSKYFAAAAVLLIFLSFGIYGYLNKGASPENNISDNYSQDIAPGSNKAVLTLADGSTIVLDEAKKGVLASLGNISVSKSSDGQVVYQITDKNPGTVSGKIKYTYNTISTPRGGQYQINLPDGTRVWLNAASSLTFPTAFTGKERKVELKGEAYFEVAKNKAMPFKVSVNNTEVQVLGTHFNVMGYTDESSTVTTLMEGSVKVVNGAESKMIIPGQQAKVAENIRVSRVNTDQAIAWKNGYFIFEDESVQSLMRKISRWYNVDIEYRGNIQSKKFAGTISKFENVSEVLRIMALTGVIHFQIEERRIIVMP